MSVRTQGGLTRARRCWRFLMADDARDMHILASAYLSHLDCRIDFAQNGRAAAEKFIRSGRYDLVLMDMQMPEMDGYAATRMIREWEGRNQARHTPILALTACPMDQEIRRALEAGCDAYVAKPVRRETLLAAIKDTLALVAASQKKKGAPAGHTELTG